MRASVSGRQREATTMTKTSDPLVAPDGSAQWVLTPSLAWGGEPIDRYLRGNAR